MNSPIACRLVVVLGFVFAPLFARGATPPDARPRGRYEFRGIYTISKLRTAVYVDTTGADPEERMKGLRKEGFSCLKNSPTRYLCAKTEKPRQWPAKVDEAIRKGLTGTAVEFPGPYSEPHLAFDGAQTEWIYNEPVQVRGVEVRLFKGVQNPERDSLIVQFPVNDEQPIPYVDYWKDDSLTLHMILSTSDGDFKLGYFVDARLSTN